MADPTKVRQVRVPDATWNAYGAVCDRLGRTRSDDILEHIHQQVREHGAPEDIDLLAQGDAELADRRARKGGRPRKNG